jgi:hypothetical protein
MSPTEQGEQNEPKGQRHSSKHDCLCGREEKVYPKKASGRFLDDICQAIAIPVAHHVRKTLT